MCVAEAGMLVGDNVREGVVEGVAEAVGKTSACLVKTGANQAGDLPPNLICTNGQARTPKMTRLKSNNSSKPAGVKRILQLEWRL
jgi:hypothetical protein